MSSSAGRGRYKSDKVPARYYLYTYWVTGSGMFPTDMLRHDSAWPADPESAEKLGNERFDTKVSVRVRSYMTPTTDRWLSFGWSVSEERPI